MNAAQSAYKSLLREYDEKRLAAESDAKRKRELIEEELPRLKQIDGEIASLHVKSATSRLRGGCADYKASLEKLCKERDELLKAKGLSLSDFETHYECSICGDTGFTPDGPCKCLRSRLTDILYDKSNIGKILEKENFENFSLEYYSDSPISEGSAISEKELAKRAYAAARKFVADFSRSDENLLISGGCGVGKTFLSNCIAKEIIEQGYFVICLSAIRLFEILSDSAFGRAGASFEPAKHIYECDLLIIDDLGTELSNSFTSTALFGCVNERLNSSKHTIISTNLSAHQLKETYSERIFSRITNRYTMIKLLGSDIRVKKRLEN